MQIYKRGINFPLRWQVTHYFQGNKRIFLIILSTTRSNITCEFVQLGMNVFLSQNIILFLLHMSLLIASIDNDKILTMLNSQLFHANINYLY